jgi:hypothetical protein
VVRDGALGCETDWAEDIRPWPSVCGPKLPFDGDADAEEFWATARRGFEEAALGFLPIFVRSVAKEFGWLELQSGWWEKARDVGFIVPAINQPVQYWIVLVANIYEPEVMTLLVRAVNELQARAPMANKDCRFLFLLDTGLPDDPDNPGMPWVDPPSWLIAEALKALDVFRVQYPAVAYFFSERDLAGRTVAEGGRIDIAAGVLRALFSSELLNEENAPKVRPKIDYWNEVAVLQHPATVGMERVAHFIEFDLSLENLSELIAREVLARWRKGVSQADNPLPPEDMLTDIEGALKDPALRDTVVEKWTKHWSATGLAITELKDVESAIAQVEIDQARDNEELGSLRALAASEGGSPIPKPPTSLLERLKRLFVGDPSPPLPRDYAGEAKRKESRILDREQLRSRLQFGLEFFQAVHREDGPFHDTIYDTHYWSENWDQRTVLLKLRRLPLDHHCPHTIRGNVSRLTECLPDHIFRILMRSSSAEEAVQQLCAELANKAKDLLNTGNADQRSRDYGVSQWIATDPQLVELLADEISERFTIPWQPIAGRKWPGHLIVFSYESPTPENRVIDAWIAVVDAIGRRGPARQPPIGTTRQELSNLNAGNEILWARWPPINSFGLLWYESNEPGRCFAKDVDHTLLTNTADRWLEEHSDLAHHLAFSPLPRISSAVPIPEDSDQS